MKRRVYFARMFLSFLYEFLFAFLLFAFFVNVWFKDDYENVMFLIILLVFVASYVIRTIANNGIIIVITHIFFALGSILLNLRPSSRNILLIIVAYLMFSSLEYLRRDSNLKMTTDIPWPTFFSCFIIYLFAKHTASTGLVTLTYVIPLLLLLIYLLMIYVDGLKIYIDGVRDMSGIPLSDIVGINTKIIGLFIVILFGLMLIGSVLNLDFVVKAVAGFAQSLFKIIVLGIKLLVAMLGKLFKRRIYDDEMISHIEDEVESLVKTNNTLEVILFVGLFVLAIFIVYKILRKIIKKLLMSKNSALDLIEDVNIPKNEKVKKIKSERFLFGKQSLAEKCRKIYKKKIETYKYDIRLDSNKTAVEINSLIIEDELGDETRLTNIYAKVRYSDEEITKSTLKEIRNL